MWWWIGRGGADEVEWLSRERGMEVGTEAKERRAGGEVVWEDRCIMGRNVAEI